MSRVRSNRLSERTEGAGVTIDDPRFASGPWVDVTSDDYGAVGDGTTDDTAAIQAAIDAARTVRGTVYFPPRASDDPYMFSNLTLWSNTTIMGSGMGAQTQLKRINGSTGTAIREKTAAEGNSGGATGIRIKDLYIDGNSTTGDGINLGNQVVGVQLNFNSLLENIHVRGFTSGTGMILNQNAAMVRYLWSNSNAKGITTQGGGSHWYGLWAEGNSDTNIEIDTNGDCYFGIHIESGASGAGGVDPSTNHLRFLAGANQNVVFGVSITVAINAANDVVYLDADANRNALYHVFTSAGAFTYPNLINDAGPSVASGGSTAGIFLIPFWIDAENQRGAIYDGRATAPVVPSAVRGLATTGVGNDNGDAAATLTVGDDAPLQRWATTLTADRAVTLSTTNAMNGDRFRIVRSAGGAFNLNVGTGPLKAVPAASWCEVEYNGSAWMLTAYGAL